MRPPFIILLSLVSPVLCQNVWKPIHSSEAIRLPVSAPGAFVTACIEQRDIDLAVSLESSAGKFRVDANVFGRECIHALGGDDSAWSLVVEPVEKRFGKGSYRVIAVQRRPVVARDELKLEAQSRFQEARRLHQGDGESRVRALAEYNRAAEAAKSSGDVRRQAESLANLGALLNNLGRYESARETLVSAEVLWSSLGDDLQRFVTRQERERSNAAMGRGGTVATASVSLAGWNRFGDRRGLAAIYRHLARGAADRREYATARAHLKQGRSYCTAIEDPVCEAKTLEGLRDIAASSGDFPNALDFARKRLSLAERFADERGMAAALSALGELYLKMNMPAGGIPFQERALGMRIRQGDETAAASLEAWLGLAYLRTGDLDKAKSFGLAGYRRSLALRGAFAGGIPRSEAQRSEWVRPLVTTFGTRAWAGVDSTDEALSGIERLRDEFILSRFTPRQPENWTVQDLLSPGDLLIYAARGDDEYFIWSIGRTGARLFRIRETDEMESYGLQLRKGLNDEFAWIPAAREISRRFLGPAQSELAAASRVIFCLSGRLSSMPMGLLLNPVSGYQPPLLTTHEIVSIPSLSFLAHSRREWIARSPNRRKIAAVGGAHYEGSAASSRAAGDEDLSRATRAIFANGTLAALPFSSREVSRIVERTRGEGREFKGGLASKALLLSDRLRPFDGLHLAVHGLLNTKMPELSGLVFSQIDENGKRIPSFLRLEEIVEREFPFRLVVLSACQTGLGKDVPFESPLGLTSGFLRSGARTVISSLWKVDDEATAATMDSFYRKYIGKNLGPAAALAAAQREIRKVPRWRYPYFWAGFIVTGDWLP